MPNSVINRRVVLGLSGYDKDAQAYFNQLTGNVSVAFKLAINTLVLSLKASGNWSELDRLWIHAAENQQNARISLVNPTSTAITEVNTPTWTANQGYTGNGATMYLNTNYNPTTGAIKLTQTSICHFNYITSSVIEDKNSSGLFEGTSLTAIAPRLSSNQSHCGLNQTAASVSLWANTSSLGLFSGNRSGATRKDYKNGSEQISYSAATQSLVNSNFYILSRNNTSLGVPDVHSSARIAISGYGSGSVNHTNLYNSIQAFATSRGFNV